MPRNSSGTMSAPPGQPVVSGTTISSATFNTLVGDLIAETTDSASRSGKGGFTAPVRGTDGTVAAPAYSFTSEVGSGFYRAGTNDVRLALGGVDKVFWATTGVGIGAAPAATAVFSLSTANQPTVDFISTGGGAGNKEGRLTYDSGAAFGAPAWVFQNLSDAGAFVANGLIVFRSGLVALGAQATPLQPASLWTAITPDTNITAGGSPAYWKDATGVVRLKGNLVNNTGGLTTNFVTTNPLPAGFRPLSGRTFAVSTGSGAPIALLVAANGQITSTTSVANGGAVYLDGISLLAEQ